MGNSRYSPCCCLPNRFGAAIVGLLSTIGTALLLALVIFLMVSPPDARHDLAFDYYKFNGTVWYLENTQRGLDPIYGGILLATLVCTFLISFMLLLGVIFESPCLVRPWIYYTGFFLVTLWITMFAVFFLQFVMYQQIGFLFIYIFILALYLLVSYYYVLIVYAYYDEIKYNY